MNDINPLRDMFRGAVRGLLVSAAPAQKPETEATLDAAGNPIVADDKKPEDDDQPVLDAVGDYSSTDIDLKVAAAVQQWAETDDLDEGEGYADRLFALLVGIADADLDGEIGDDEADLLEMAADSTWDYLSDKGVADDDLELLLNDWDNDVGARVHELIVGKLPDGDEASAADIDAFAFGDGSDEAALDAVGLSKQQMAKLKKKFDGKVKVKDGTIHVFGTMPNTNQEGWYEYGGVNDKDTERRIEALDSVVLDATYKKKVVVRKGKKMRVMKRVSGTVRLSAKQKLAVRKMLRKSHGAKATMRRAKSMRVRRQMGI